MIFDNNLFFGKKIIVTGASSGIGKAVSLGLARLNSDLLLFGRDKTRLESVVQQASNLTNGIVESHACEFGEIDASLATIKVACEGFGPVDGCFHSSGVELLKPLRLTKGQDFERLLESSVNPAFALTRLFASKGFANSGASIVLMSSVSGLTGQTGMAAYASSKSALSGLVKAAACELCHSKTTINQICAGAIDSEMHRRISKFSTQEALSNYEDAHLLGIGSLDDVSSAALFLLSPGAKWITGTTMVVDGGFTVR